MSVDSWRRRGILGRALASSVASSIASGVAIRAGLGLTVPAALAAPLAQQAPLAGRPMYQQDARHSGRSLYAGPRRALLLRTFDTTNPGADVPPGTNADIQSSTIVGSDGTIYQTTFTGALFALRDPGTGRALQLRWWFKPEDSTSAHSPPAVGSDGTLYAIFATRTNPVSTLYAVRAPRTGLQGDCLERGPRRGTHHLLAHHWSGRHGLHCQRQRRAARHRTIWPGGLDGAGRAGQPHRGLHRARWHSVRAQPGRQYLRCRSAYG